MGLENSQNEENKDQNIESINDGIVVESIEDDMKRLGIESDEQESNDGEDKGESQEEPKKEEAKTEKKPKKSRAQKKIERQAREIKELKANANQEPIREDQHEQEDDEPKVEDFEDYDDYLDALEEQSSKKEDKKVVTPVEVKSQPDTRIQDMLEDGNEDYDNFQELVEAPDLALTQGLLNLVLEAEAPADVAYYLASNKNETKELAKLSKRQQEKAILKMELKLENGEEKKEVKQSKAPEPINPLNGGSNSAKTINDDDLSYEDHEKLLNSKRTKSVGGFL